MRLNAEEIETYVEKAAEAVQQMRSSGSVVHCITNTVAQNFTANVLLACGATPSMTVSSEEVKYFTSKADAVLINLGTLDEQRKTAIRNSLSVLKASEKPFVLDPVMCHVSPPRLDFAKEVMTRNPAIIRMNESEAKALEVTVEDSGSVVALTGQTDLLKTRNSELEVSNGHVWLSKVTAIGCAQGAIMAALLVHADNDLTAALGAVLLMNIAGERAAKAASGPGSFQANLLDQLHSLPLSEFIKGAKAS